MGDQLKNEPGLYEHLIDAEREALARGGKPVGKIALIKALREASGLSLRDAKRSVEWYLARRGGQVPTEPPAERLGGWIDDLLDAERAAASKEDRPINKILLITTLREASGLGLAEAKRAVEDYLRRRGGQDLSSGGANGWMIAIAVIAMIIATVYFASR